MRRIEVVGLVLVAVLAIGAMFAGTASAKKANLVLREGGEHFYEGLDPVVPVGGPVELSFETSFGGCATTGPILGEIKTNSSPLDPIVIEGGPSAETLCSDEYEGNTDKMSVKLAEVPLSSKGTVKKILGGLDFNIWGPYGSEKECGYTFDSFHNAKGTFELPEAGKAGEAIIKGTAHSVGKHQNKACPKKETITFTLTLADNGGFPLETTLEG